MNEIKKNNHIKTRSNGTIYVDKNVFYNDEKVINDIKKLKEIYGRNKK